MEQIRYLKGYPEKRDSIFDLHGIGIGDIGPAGIIDRPNGTGDYLLIFLSPPSVMEIDGVPASITGPSFFILTPGIGQKYGCEVADWPHSWIHCCGRLVEESISEYSLPVNVCISFPNNELIDKYLGFIHRELSSERQPSSLIVRNFFQNFLFEVAREFHAGERDQRFPPVVRSAREVLDNHFSDDISITNLAKKIGVSSSLLRREFKKYTGFSPQSYLINVRMLNAKEMLKNRNLLVKSVAARVGYEDVGHFSKLFKAFTGFSPERYRELEV